MAEEPKPYFDEQKQAQVVDWITKKTAARGLVCECCGEKKWNVQENVVYSSIYDGTVQLGGTIYPFAVLVCTNCANTKFFNVVQMGLILPKGGGDV